MTKKFDQDAKARVVRLVEDRILEENMSIQEACKILAPKPGVSGILSGKVRRQLYASDASLILCLKILSQRWPGYVVKTTSYGTPMSC